MVLKKTEALNESKASEIIGLREINYLHPTKFW